MKDISYLGKYNNKSHIYDDDVYKRDKKDPGNPSGMTKGNKKKVTTRDMVRSFSMDLDNATRNLKDLLSEEHPGWRGNTRIVRDRRTGRTKSVDLKNREGIYQAKSRANPNTLMNNTHFSILGGVGQKAIGVIPIYGKYNKYKKKKALHAAGKYVGKIDKNTDYDNFRIGDDFSDLKKDIAVKLFGTHKDLSPEQKRMVKAYLKRLMGGETIYVTRMQGVNVN